MKYFQIMQASKYLFELTPAHQMHLWRNGSNFSSETGFGENFLASQDGMDAFHHFRNLIFWNCEVLHVAIICNFSNVISGTAFVVQRFSTYKYLVYFQTQNQATLIEIFSFFLK